MLRRSILSAAFSLFAFAALADNNIVPTPPVNDNSNRAASTAYVVKQISSQAAFLVPGTTQISPLTNGGVLFDNNGVLGDSTILPSGLTIPGPTVTGDILIQPTFTGANPGNAGVYSVIANPANGYTTIWNGVTFQQGATIPVGSQFGANTVGMQQALVATIDIPSGDVAANGGYAFAAYGRTHSTTTGAQGILGVGMCAAEGAALCEGGNFGLSNGTVFNGVSFTGFDFAFGAAQESDLSLMKVSGGADPTGALYGAYYTGAGNLTGPLGTGVGVDVLSQTTNAKWANGFIALAGCCVNGYVAGPSGKGNGVGSQPFLMENTSAGAVLGFAEMLSDASANIALIPAIAVGGAIALQDGLGHTILGTTPTSVAVNKIATFPDAGTWGVSGIAATTINATTGFSANGTAGLASKSCAITTGNVSTGITLTIKEGLITGVTTC